MNISSHKFDGKKNTRMNSPYVNSEICTGCEVCIESWPMETIELIHNIAAIKESKCTIV